MVVSIIFFYYYFHPENWGKIPILTNIFLKWVETTNAFQIGPICRFLSGLSSAKSVRPLTVAPSSWSRQASFMAEKVNLDEDVDVSKNSGTPKSSFFNRVFHYKPSILGYHYFWKHPRPSLVCFFCFWIQRQGVFPKWRRPELHVSSRWWYKQVDSYWSGEALILEFWWKNMVVSMMVVSFHIYGPICKSQLVVNWWFGLVDSSDPRKWKGLGFLG